MRTRRFFSGVCLAALLATTVEAAADTPAGAPVGDARAVLEQGRARQALASYDEAAERYETFVRMSPGAAEAKEALKDAIVLRLGLGQRDRAIKDADFFVETYGAADRAQAAVVSWAIASHFLEREDYAAARKRLEAWVPAFDAHAPLDLRIQVHAGLGRTLVKLSPPLGKPEVEYGLVRDLWKDPRAAEKAVRAAGAEDGADRRLAKALNGVGEALFYFAEQKRAEADKLRAPAYHGRATVAEIRQFVATKVAVWVRDKRAAVEAAERAYREVVEIQPMPPPRWVLASASRVGKLWARFVAELRATPIPREWKGNGTAPGTKMTYTEIRRAYFGAMDAASEPMREQAKSAFRMCVDYSTKYQYTDAFSRVCHEWLEKQDKAYGPPLDEIMPQPVWLDGSALPGAPLPDPR